LLQVFVSSLRLFQGIETSGIEVISELVALAVIGETGVQGVEAEGLDLEVSHAWPVGELMLDSVNWSLRIVAIPCAGA